MHLGTLPRLATVRPRRLVLLGLIAALLAAVVVTLNGAGRASAYSPEWIAKRCAEFRAGSAERAAEPTGPSTGERVVVIGDSWSAGLGLRHSVQSWPSRLGGRVEVAGFSGSGFAAHSSPCGRVSFADRAGRALRGGADLVVVEGGLNDVDQRSAAITAGFTRLMSELQGYRVVVVGPASAPSRARGVPRVDHLLAELSASYGVPYVDASDLRLDYLHDRLHLTPAGHREFGDAVARRIAAVS